MSKKGSFIFVVLSISLTGMIYGAHAGASQQSVNPARIAQPSGELDNWASSADAASPFAPTWIVETVDGSRQVGVVGRRNLQVDSNGVPHIVYGGYHLYHAWDDGHGWQWEVVDDSPDVGGFATLALDSADKIHIGYYDAAHNQLKYAHWNGVYWQSEKVYQFLLPSVAGSASLALDNEDKPHFSLMDLNHSSGYNWLEHVFSNAGGWDVEQIERVWDASSVTSMAIGSNNQIHIGYFDHEAAALGYARWDGVSWHHETVDIGIRLFSSLALDSHDQVHIVYIKNDDLRYGHWDGSGWLIETVDTTFYYNGVLGTLSLDSDDRPHISYLTKEIIPELAGTAGYYDVLHYAHWDVGMEVCGKLKRPAALLKARLFHWL